MSSTVLKLPLIDIDDYINPKAPGDRERVIAEVREACETFGFFQTTGHNIPLQKQEGLFKSISTLFELPQEEKRKLSFLANRCRRGYEESGMSLRTGDAMPDSKEVREYEIPLSDVSQAAVMALYIFIQANSSFQSLFTSVAKIQL